MANASTPQQWNLAMAAGSLQDWVFTFAYPSTGALYPISGLTWEWVVRASGTAGGSPLISVTTAENSQGVLNVSTAASTVELLLYPAATSALNGQYVHALWANPGSATSAYTWLAGDLTVNANPQP